MVCLLYQQARYYDLAFSFVNVSEQVDNLFEPLIKRHSLVPARSVLDVCCGPSRQLRELAGRGYEAIGLDSSREMLGYLRSKADGEGVRVQTIEADMGEFRLGRTVDFAYILMGSIAFVGDNDGMLRHLGAMAGGLIPGGLYLIENLFADWTNPCSDEPQTWEMTADGIAVQTTFQRQVSDAMRQTVRDRLVMEVDDNGRHRRFIDERESKLFFPEEFRALVELQGAFEFLGYFERYRPEPLSRCSWDHTALLRKR